MRHALVLAALATLVTAAAGCSDSSADTEPTSTIEVPATTVPPTTGAPTSVASTTVPPTTVPPATVPPTTAPPTTVPPTTTTLPALGAGSTLHVLPVGADAGPGWGTTHSEYPATDVFAACGTTIVSPVDGTVVHVRTEDAWDAAVDDPATRGGRSVAVLGDDGVRYYMAHLDTIEPATVVGAAVTAGQPIATLGRTGRASACHLHFALSVLCPGPEWSVRRGVIWPYPYLDDWRDGIDASPVDELIAWSAANPDACAAAMADPHAGNAG